MKLSDVTNPGTAIVVVMVGLGALFSFMSGVPWAEKKAVEQLWIAAEKHDKKVDELREKQSAFSERLRGVEMEVKNLGDGIKKSNEGVDELLQLQREQQRKAK